MKKTFKLLNCHPKKTRKNKTCYDTKTLIILKNKWNETNPDKIKTTDPNKIWSMLKEKINNCENELCWLKTLNDTNLTHKVMKEFVPNAPTAEWAKYNNWLSSTDFNNVMKQYSETYPNFLYLGPSSIDFDTIIDGKCVWPTLCKLNIEKQLKRGKNKIGIVLNLDKHDGKGSHWVSIFIDLQKKFIFYFESTGSVIPTEITTFIDRMNEQCKSVGLNMKIMNNMKIKHQYGTSECGMYCLYFIINLLSGNKTPQHFLKNRIKDEEMTKLRELYFNKV
jgi:hypothetical protein